MDAAALYGHDNPELTGRLCAGAFQLQPELRGDVSAAAAIVTGNLQVPPPPLPPPNACLSHPPLRLCFSPVQRSHEGDFPLPHPHGSGYRLGR